ncbi:syntaxin-17 [Trichogramma pretiosum]|uniref:syntaxin-17 n=1 Tax=Trichogramma pretiosum TaxID=7493 RepID=UPI0006C9A5F3|nr:syntaxin-17 [Trichogramma pretiosum]XP_014222933.1 syntaxin-17 [Trichogramma pretiosum]
MSSPIKEVVTKQPIKRLEIPINKFNDVAIPHHTDLLKRHKNNIIKYQNVRDWDKVYTEQINASRVVKQLKQLLYEMDTLRGQVIDNDIPTFDKLTIKARTSTLNAINEYLEFQIDLSSTDKNSLKEETPTHENSSLDNQFLQIQAEQEDLDQQEACLRAWTSLQNDLQELQHLFLDFNKLVHEQAESVDKIEDFVEESQINIKEGNKNLQQAAKYKLVGYPIAGALLGTCLGGPVGLAVGLKLGGLAAIGGGLLGFTGGTLLKKKCLLLPELKQIEAPKESENLQGHNNHQDKKNS